MKDVKSDGTTSKSENATGFGADLKTEYAAIKDKVMADMRLSISEPEAVSEDSDPLSGMQ